MSMVRDRGIGALSKLTGVMTVAAGAVCEKRFKHMTIAGQRRNNRTLKKILKRGRNTKLGRIYNFKEIYTPNEYMIKVPLSTYKDYEEYIDRMAEGEKNLMVPDKVRFFGLSSGTTGGQKMLPVTGKSLKVNSPYMAILAQKVLYNSFKGEYFYGRGMMLTDMKMSGETPCKIPVCSGTSGGMKSIKKLIPLIWTSPVEVMQVKDSYAFLYLHLLFGLKERKLMHVSGVFISAVLDAFRFLESNWQDITEDIRRGRINKSLIIDRDTRSVLSKKISPDAMRADELEREFKKGFSGIAKRIWPKILYIVCVTGGSFSIYDSKLAWYTGDLPVYSGIYAATEALIGINFDIHKKEYVLTPDTAFFEFIPQERMNDDKPMTATMSQLEDGKCYEVVVTSWNGLYRYRLGDVVKVKGYYNNTPVIEFLYRKNQLLNMVSEKTTEEQAGHAVKLAMKMLDIDFADYTTIPDNSISPGRYIFIIEIRNNPKRYNENRIAEVLEQELSTANPAYGRMRGKGKLARVKVNIVSKGTFQKYVNTMMDRGVSKSQIKVPRVLYDKERIEMFK